MLTKKEPYRYATPTSTQSKLAGLRIAATGERRRGGNPKGSQRSRNGAVKTLAVKALATVYAEEGLPALSEPTPGERRAVHAIGAAAFAKGLKTARRVPRKSPDSAPKSRKKQPS